MAQNQITPAQQNMIARANLLSTGISMIKRLQPVNGALGSTIKIPLLRMGIMTGVLLQFDVPITVAGGAAVPSPVAPWNLANQVEYKDFAGVSRTRTNGFQLFAGQTMKQSDALSMVPAQGYASGGSGPSMVSDTNIINVPTATGTMRFSLYVPMAYDPASDLTGAVLTQTNVGEHYINVQLPNNIVSADPWNTPYVTQAGVTVTAPSGVTVQAFQYYIQPQAMTLDNLPMIDLGMIYGFEGGFTSTDNISAGMSHYINYPNNRSVLAALINFENGSAFTPNGADLDGITLLANSNTNFQELTPRLVRETMRNIAQCDVPGASYYLGSRRQPIQTQLYANVQSKMDVAAVNASVTRFISQFEIIYPSGTPLPGIGGQ